MRQCVQLENNNVYSTRYSQAVTHPSTNRARRCLTSVIGRELVLSTWYGRRHKLPFSKLCISAACGMRAVRSVNVRYTYNVRRVIVFVALFYI